jgi:hypothetical protein
MVQIREEVAFTKGRIIVRGKLVTRGKPKRADYILYYKPNIPIAVIEAKDNNHSVGDGMQQALDYAVTLNIPFVFSSNGDGFVFHDRAGLSSEKEASLTLDQFPTPKQLWSKYCKWKGITPDEEEIILQDYFDDGSGKAPRYYQSNAINAAIEAIAKGKNRVLLVMATGTGKTYTAFQIIWRLWKAGRKKRILFLADRNVLVDQTMVNDFRPFGPAMAKLSTGARTIEREDGSEVELTTALDKKRRIDTAYEVYLGLYQAITGPEERQKLFREFSPGFFDLIVIDECHRGSAADDAAWREILEYFSAATQIGLTATPKETKYVSNIHYFGKPVYTYSLKQGIEDGFLAPYKVIKVHIDLDVQGYRPERGDTDRDGNEIEDRIYNTKDFDRNIVIDDRTKLVSRKVSDFLKESRDRFQKTIIFCVDEEHAARMQKPLIFHTDLSNPGGASGTIFPPLVWGVANPWNYPQIQKWSAGIQQEVGFDTSVSVAYVGTKGTHLLGSLNLNQPTPAGQQQVVAGANVNTVRPYPGYGTVYFVDPVFGSNYNSLQVSVLHRLRHDVAFQVSYTYSQAKTDNSSPWNIPQDSRNIRADNGLASFDIPQVLTFNYLWDIPAFHGSSGVTKTLLAGWQVSGITEVQKGIPSTVTLTTDNAGVGGGLERADQVASADGPKTKTRWFNTSAFTYPTTATFGNEKNGAVRGPGFVNFDFALGKRFFVREATNLEFKAQAFNIFNHVSYQNVDTSLGPPSSPNADFGHLSNPLAPRTLQLSLALSF